MTARNIAFRVDASSQTGTGHFMRCLTLASGLIQRGANVLFLCRELPAHLGDMLEKKGVELKILGDHARKEQTGDLAHSHWLGTSQELDADATLRALAGREWDWLIVDHYALDARWESAVRDVVGRIMVIDDLADRRHDCDMLLDQNYYADMQVRYTDKVPPRCKLLLGPRYALLRDEFRQLRPSIKLRTSAVRRILVFFGGVDADDYTGQAIRALGELKMAEIEVDVVIGARHPQRESIVRTCAEHRFSCHVQTEQMAALMASADLAIGAGGSATWERCCLGLPALVFCTAANQRKQVADAARQGLLYAPEVPGDLGRCIQTHLRALVENAGLRELISRNAMQIVNGRGLSHIMTNLGMSDIELRRATVDDSENLFLWRNHPAIREVSRNKEALDWQSHQRWFASVLHDPAKAVLIGLRAERPVGVVRFDKQNDEMEISIYTVPGQTAPGTGGDLLQVAEGWLAVNHPEIRKIRAHVLGTNERSQRLFSAAGYQLESANYLKQLT